jgi:uncharacterized protein YbcI
VIQKRPAGEASLYAWRVDQTGPSEQILSSGELGAAISNAVVRIHAEHKGRGPTRAKTYVFEDVILTVMEEGAAEVVRTLTDAGDDNLVQNIHTRLQDAIAEELKAEVEKITRRSVRAVISGSEVDMEIDCAVFLLEPDDKPNH